MKRIFVFWYFVPFEFLQAGSGGDLPPLGWDDAELARPEYEEAVRSSGKAINNKKKISSGKLTQS